MNKLKELRIEKGFTVRKLEELSGVSHNTIARIESGRKAEPLTIRKLAIALGVDWRTMLELTDEAPFEWPLAS